MRWIHCNMFAVICLASALGLNKTSPSFKIDLGILFPIYHRDSDETCDKENVFKSSLKVWLAIKVKT